MTMPPRWAMTPPPPGPRMPSRGPTRGQNCYVTLAFLGIPPKGDKIRSGCLTFAFSGAHKMVEMLCNPCVLEDPPKKGTKSEVAAPPLPSWGPKRGHNCYVTLAFPGVPNKGDKIRGGYLTHALSGAHKRAELLCNPCVLRDPPKKGTKSEVSGKGPCWRSWQARRRPASSRPCRPSSLWRRRPQGTRRRRAEVPSPNPVTHTWASSSTSTRTTSTWLPQPCLLGGRQEGGIAK